MAEASTATFRPSCLKCSYHEQLTIGPNIHNCTKYPDMIGAFPNSCYNARYDALMCGRDGWGFIEKQQP